MKIITIQVKFIVADGRNAKRSPFSSNNMLPFSFIPVFYYNMRLQVGTWSVHLFAINALQV